MVVGTRRISHSALVGLILLSGLHLVVALAGWETLATFAVIQALTMGCFGLATSNFSAMAMENMGAIAGTASSVQGFTTLTNGELIGAVIGQAFDGTTVTMFLCCFLAGMIELANVALDERGRLIQIGRAHVRNP